MSDHHMKHETAKQDNQALHTHLIKADKSSEALKTLQTPDATVIFGSNLNAAFR